MDPLSMSTCSFGACAGRFGRQKLSLKKLANITKLKPQLPTLDAAREQMSVGDGDALNHSLHLARVAREALKRVPGLRVLSMENLMDSNMKGAISMDPLRIIMGLSGFEADDILRSEHCVVAELSSPKSIAFVATLGTSSQDIKFLSISRTRPSSSPLTKQSCCNRDTIASVFSANESHGVLSSRQVFFAATRRVGRKDACGRTCVELIAHILRYPNIDFG